MSDRLDCDTICPVSNLPVKDMCPSAEERKEGEEEENEEGCTGSDCGFCNENPVVCGIVGFLGTALVFATALFIRKSLKWRKDAKSMKTTQNRTAVTYERGSQPYLGGVPPSVFLQDHTRSLHARTLPVEIQARTLPIEDLLSRMDYQPNNQPFCCTKSLPAKNAHAVQFQPIQNQLLSTAVPTISFNNFSRINGSQEFVCRFDDVFSDEGQNMGSRGVEVEPREVFGDVVRTGDGTLFDRYNEQDWKEEEEVEI